MGFWDKAKDFMESANERIEYQLRKMVTKMSDSQLLDRYNNAESNKFREIAEEELRKRGLL